MSDKIQQRGVLRGFATRIINQLETLITDSDVNKVSIEVKVKVLLSQRKKINELNELIQNSLSDKPLEDDMEETFRRDMAIEECLHMAQDRISKLEVPLQVAPPSASNSSSLAKLPILNLTSFSGDSLDWPSFWDNFSSNVHARRDITAAQKLSYLMGQLKGEARQLLEGFTLTDSHYTEAAELLRETYGKPNKIIQAHLHSLFDLRCDGSSAVDLGRYRAAYESHLRGLKAMGCEVEDAGFVFTALLLRKLPTKIKDNLNRSSTTDSWTLKSFQTSINKEIELLSASEAPSSKKERIEKREKEDGLQKQKDKTFPEGGQTNKSTVSSFNVSASLQKNPHCKFCFEPHFQSECKKYDSVTKRTERVKELNLCYNCLSNSHSVSGCKSKFSCKICKKKHNNALCYKQNSTVISLGEKSEESVSVTSVFSTENNVALPTAFLPLVAKDNPIKARGLFDQGAQKSFITNSLTLKLGLKPIRNVFLKIKGIFSSQRHCYEVVQVDYDVAGVPSMEAVVIPRLPSLTMDGISRVIEHLKEMGVTLADEQVSSDSMSDIDILVGGDNYTKYVHGIVLWGDTHLIKSVFGVMVAGPLTLQLSNDFKIKEPEPLSMATTVVQEKKESDMGLEKLWTLDTLGIGQTNSDTDTNEVLKTFEDTVEFNEGQYTVSLPWKRGHKALKSNLSLARGRLRSTLNRLRGNPDSLHMYDKIINDYLNKGFIEIVKDVAPGQQDLHFLPHHGVLKNSSTTPLRIVFDCSAGSPSLNDCLHSGPSLLNDLGMVLLRFRCCKYAFISDIAKAFLMIQLEESDRNATCFLWPEDPWEDNGNLQVFRFKVVLFGATCSPFLLNATIMHHLKNSLSKVSKQILRRLYVDNLQATANEESVLVDFGEESIRILQEANMSLREWSSNSSALIEKLRSRDPKIVNFDSRAKILGLEWRVGEDLISFPCINLYPQKTITKRSIISSLSKLFDPLGLLTPVSVRSRIYMQSLWKKKLSWDEPLVENTEEILEILSDMQDTAKVWFPRRIDSKLNLALHAFCDASMMAYAVAIYAVSIEGSYLVMSKARVAPLKALSIPKLELTAATLSVRLMCYVLDAYSDEFKFQSVNFWTDSRVVLCWLQSKKELKQFERSRVEEILTKSNVEQWRYVPSKCNPADLPSRGMKVRDFVTSTLWFNGPNWLINEELWPHAGDCNSQELDDLEEKAILAAVVISEDKESNISCSKKQCPINIYRFSSFTKLLQTTAMVFKAVALFRKDVRPSELLITAKDIEEAKNFWIRDAQKEFQRECDYLKKPNSGKSPTLVGQLNLFVKNGIIRCRGRVENADLDWRSKFPILLPTHHHFTYLIIVDAHFQVNHFGVSSVVSYLRQSIWIPKMRQRVKAILRPCVVCKKVQGAPYPAPNCPSLPAERVKEARPFSTCGVDYTGALTVRDEGQLSKAYVVLFTCAITRAVHLEVVEDNSSETFIFAFRRFVGRRSCPKLMISDNATTFCSAAKFLQELSNCGEVQSMLSNFHCEWRFIPARAAWYGESDPSFVTASRLTARQRSYDRVRSQLWGRWRTEYLLAIRERSQCIKKKLKQVLGVGDLVVIHDDLVHRSHWNLGRITRLVESRDGCIRAALVKTARGELSRPITKLYPLEITCVEKEFRVANNTQIKEKSRAQPHRRAAELAKKKITSLAAD